MYSDNETEKTGCYLILAIIIAIILLINYNKTKIMYKQNPIQKGTIKVNKGYQGETIEAKMRRIMSNQEPITDGAPRVYTDRKEGVKPDYNIRTDRWEHATEAMDKRTKSVRGKREGKGTIGDQAKEGMNKESKTEKPNDGKPDSNKATS